MKLKKLKNVKIINKLTISASIFLLPLGIMLYSVLSISLASIKKDQNELYGIEVLRPAVTLLQAIPQYIRYSLDGMPGDLEFTKRQITDSYAVMEEKYVKYFGYGGYIVSPVSIRENFDHLFNSGIRETVFWAYRQLMQDIYKIILYIGDFSGLVTDSDIKNAYLIAATVYELPLAQDRLVLIGNILRTIEDGAYTQMRRTELLRNLDLLVYSDNARIQNRFYSSGMIMVNDTEALEYYQLLLRTCHDRISFFTQEVLNEANEAFTDISRLPMLYDASINANNAIYRLQTASFDYLDEDISKRISSYRFRLILSFTAVIIAASLAFFIIFISIMNIKKSTHNMSTIFKRLDENDLSVKIESFSGDEFGQFMSALNGFLVKLQNTFTSFNKNTSMVTSAVHELSSSAKEITATANEQSASVSEIVSTMENNRELSSQASEKTMEVANLAAQTQELSRRGADLRDYNEEMMLDIRNQNIKITDIIKNLAEMLSRIDESIKLIDTIADHTKLIAFNATLEASSSGEAGLRFSVVASEIRRFADNVVESASEIKERISELNEATQNLLTEANNGSNAIDAGYKRMVEQKEVFENIVEVSQNVANRSQQISSLTKQQEYALTQIFTALKEISAGVSQFVSSTKMTSAAAEKLNNMSVELKETLAVYHIKNEAYL